MSKLKDATEEYLNPGLLKILSWRSSTVPASCMKVDRVETNQLNIVSQLRRGIFHPGKSWL